MCIINKNKHNFAIQPTNKTLLISQINYSIKCLLTNKFTNYLTVTRRLPFDVTTLKTIYYKRQIIFTFIQKYNLLNTLGYKQIT